jgi:hypothetical protein
MFTLQTRPVGGPALSLGAFLRCQIDISETVLDFFWKIPSDQYVTKNNCTRRVRDGKEWEKPENLDFSSVAATFEKATT